MTNHLEITKLPFLYLVAQPIFRVDEKNEKVIAYELLIRSRKDDSFPAELFEKIVLDQELNRQLLSWYSIEVLKIVSKTEEKININIHPQQLYYPETFDMLNKLAKYRTQICVEITEHDTQPSIKDNSKSFLLEVIKNIKRLGFLVALDDVNTGIHTFDNIVFFLADIDLLKFSIIPFKDKPCDVFLIINFWNCIAKEKKITLLVEGIEDYKTKNQLIECGIFFQQGFQLGEPKLL